MKKTRIFCIGKRALIIAAAVVVALAAILIFTPKAAHAWSPDREIPIYCVDTAGEKKASLTFDAAWGNEDTQELIDILAKYDVKATFFVVGDWARKYPESVKALSDAGHEVMNHSDKHPDLTTLSLDAMTAEITACNDAVAAITGVTPTLIRVPYGAYNDQVVSTIRSMGMEAVQWDVDSLDWKELSAAEITDRVVGKADCGSIILFHNAAKHTPEALPGIIENLQSQGFELIKASQLIYDGEYTLDHTGRQIPS
ncbi:MAG: polysaccharide deacetylase family protein [Oscillospiraceae bacterium]|nr:polysaccharide deacetylase family protein [Oscillospiraceae bacterium]